MFLIDAHISHGMQVWNYKNVSYGSIYFETTFDTNQIMIVNVNKASKFVISIAFFFY